MICSGSGWQLSGKGTWLTAIWSDSTHCSAPRITWKASCLSTVVLNTVRCRYNAVNFLFCGFSICLIFCPVPVSETRDSTSEQLMTMFSAVALFCSIPVILICHDPLLESTYCFFFIWLTISCIAVSITAVHASPFRVASMSAVRYDLIGGLPTCL